MTQFYAIGVSREGWVAGGTQDNGNPFIDFTGNSEKAEVRNLPSGDGGFMQFSVINPSAFFWESQMGNAKRSPDKGDGADDEIFKPICGECEDPERKAAGDPPLAGRGERDGEAVQAFQQDILLRVLSLRRRGCCSGIRRR